MMFKVVATIVFETDKFQVTTLFLIKQLRVSLSLNDSDLSRSFKSTGICLSGWFWFLSNQVRMIVTELEISKDFELQLLSYVSLAQINRANIGYKWAVVVPQLAEQSLPTPEVRGSNSVIGKICTLPTVL